MWIMGLREEFNEAVDAIDSMDFSTCSLEELNVFETTIRYLGGFLAAYDLSGNKILLKKATQMGDMLYAAFDTPNRMPITRWKFKEAAAGITQEAHIWVIVPEIGSLTLEFTHLSQLTGDPKYYDAVHRVMEVFEHQQMQTNLPGMWPISVDARNKNFRMDTGFTIGGLADSMYEYLPKQHMLLGGGTEMYEKLYQNALETMKKYIFYRPMVPDGENLLVPGHVRVFDKGDLENREVTYEAQHLGCFAGGMVSIGAKIFRKDTDLDVGKRLVEGCLWGYEKMPQGIMPEIMELTPCPSNSSCEWDEDVWLQEVHKSHPGEDSPRMTVQNRRLPKGVVKVRDTHYILR
jgi:mannosyl-oligosaccharide alpha-1,2-mannosidase